MNKCKGITVHGKKCLRKISHGDYCYYHKDRTRLGYRQEKPKSCPICCESIYRQKCPLSCGHWVHKECVIRSAKAECPICRAELDLGPRASKRIQRLAQKRYHEAILEEEEELRAELDFDENWDPELQQQIQNAIIEHLILDSSMLETELMLAEFLQDVTYETLVNSVFEYSVI